MNWETLYSMIALKDILYKTGLLEVVGSTAVNIHSLSLDSRKAEAGSLFIAVKGTLVDGHVFIPLAIENGAIAILCETMPSELVESVTYVRVADSSKALGIAAANFYDNPSAKLKLVGITGTNGKTTIATQLFKLFMGLGYSTGLLSTVENRINGKIIPTAHTTPDAITLNALLADMITAGCSHCFMEVSSHAVVQNRIAGLRFVGGVFTNLTHDHLDFHGTIQEYLRAKKQFFDELPPRAFAITNADDRNGMVMIQNCRAHVKTYSLRSMADYHCKVMESQFEGTKLNLGGIEIWTFLVGRFNAYNFAAIYATALELEEKQGEVLTLMSQLRPVEGRFETVRSVQGVVGIIDYAHTPDALKNVLETINELRTRNETLITIIGAGGDRDRSKRPEMAKISAALSDKLILTADNPRSEDPEAIIQEMKAGLDPVLVRKAVAIVNRREAIQAAVIMSKPGDIILLAGKGHEKYQEIKGIRHPFDDKVELEKALQIGNNETIQ